MRTRTTLDGPRGKVLVVSQIGTFIGFVLLALAGQLLDAPRTR
jgi:hypothetical protein